MLSPNGGQGRARHFRQQEGTRSLQVINCGQEGTALKVLQAGTAHCYPPDPPHPRPEKAMTGAWALKLCARSLSLAFLAGDEGDLGDES